jgi:hypothetical protein
MALLTSSSRRFARSRDYSHNQRRDRVERVRERIDLVAPHARLAPRAPR